MIGSAAFGLERMYDAAVRASGGAPVLVPADRRVFADIKTDRAVNRVVEKFVYKKRPKGSYAKPKAGTVVLDAEIVAQRLSGKKVRERIDAQWVLDRIRDGKCMATGVSFDLSVVNGRANPLYPSIDRIDSARGYEPDNVQIVVLAFNSMKSTMPMADAENIILAMAENIQARRNESIK